MGPGRRGVPPRQAGEVLDAVRRLRERRVLPEHGRDILWQAGHIVDSDQLTRTAAVGGDGLARAHLTRHVTDPGSGHLVERRRRVVRVCGPATVSEPLSQALAAAGCDGAGAPALMVSCGTPRAGQLHDWMLDGVPHLVVSPRAASVRIGPLVVPGRTACLQCLDLARRDSDPAWPSLTRQLQARGTPLPDPVLVASAAALAAGCITRWLETGYDDICHGFWVVTPDTPVPAWRAVVRHPECGCWWPAAPVA